MTDRERLLDILNKPIFPHDLVDPLEAVADYLLDNGVTFAKDTDVPSKWISVEDGLPKKITNKVLVYCKNGYIGFGHYEKFQGVEDWYNLESGKPFREWDLEDCETYEVAHWMPLPEPPKEG